MSANFHVLTETDMSNRGQLTSNDRVKTWISDLQSNYSQECPPSEPSSFRDAYSQIGSSHRALTEDTVIPERKSGVSTSIKSQSKPKSSSRSKYSASAVALDKKVSLRGSSSSPVTASNHGITNIQQHENLQSRGSSSSRSKIAPAASRSRQGSQVTPVQPRSQSRLDQATLIDSHASSTSSSQHRNAISKSPKAFLDPYSAAIEQRLEQGYRQMEDETDAILRRRFHESDDMYRSRINSEIQRNRDDIADLDLRWQMLEMEKAAGRR
jgi:hypothetical protein